MFDNVGDWKIVVKLIDKKVVVALLALSMGFSSWFIILPVSSSGNAVLSFSPAQSSTTFPQPVILNVTLSNVVNLNTWQIKVAFDPAVLVYSGITIPADNLLDPFGGWLDPDMPYTDNNTAGYFIAVLALDGTQVVNGSGTLCQLTFNVVRGGVSAVTLADIGIRYRGTVLLDGSSPTPNLIPFNTVNGNVQVSSNPTASFTYIPMKPSANKTAIFDSSFSQPGWSPQIHGLAPIVNYTWNFGDGTQASTTGDSTMQHIFLQIGNYSVTLTVTDSVSQTGQTTQIVQVVNRTAYDLDGDSRITDMRDIAIAARAFNTVPGDPLWNPVADITGPILLVPDGTVNMRDIAAVAKHFREPE